MPIPISANVQTPNSQKPINIHTRIFNFVVSVLKLLKSLPKTQQNLILINQITRSVTSMGANGQEADGSTSRNQFFNSFTIVKKETKETNYWLGIIYETNEGFQSKMKDIVREGKEIEAIVSSIVQKDDRIKK